MSIFRERLREALKIDKTITEEEYKQELEEAKEENKQIEYKQKIAKEKNKYKVKKKIETSKLIALYLFILLNSIVIYAMVAMWKFVDFSYLGVLISDIAAQVLIYAIYCMKAYKAKKSEEELKFEREKLSGNIGDILDAGARSHEFVPTSKSVEVFHSDTDNGVG